METARISFRKRILTNLSVVFAIVIVGTVFALLGGALKQDSEVASEKVELYDVEIAIASLMAAPVVPVRDLSTDPRIASYMSCSSPLIRPDKDADDEELEAAGYTCDINTLIVINPGTDIMPLTHYTRNTEWENWYCVHNDGTVVGFTDEKPHTNIWDL